jgi:hypothetical protein
MVHQYVWYNGYGLTIYVSFMVKCMCVIWALDPMIVYDQRSLKGQSLQNEHY